MSRLLTAIVLLFGLVSGTPGAAQSTTELAPSADQWLISETRIASRGAHIALPRVAGAISAYRHQEFSHPGAGIDNAVQYRSADRQIFGTAYVYLPGLAHSGLAAYATDAGIRETASRPIIGGFARSVDAGGVYGAAIRADYGGLRDGLASSAAFIKAGRWIIKLRVSGPEARRADVEAAMDALLQGVQFGAASPVHPAAPITVFDCPQGSGQTPATLLPDPAGAEIAAHGFILTFDGGGIEATGADGSRNDLPPRVPSEFCLSTHLRTRAGLIAVLRAEDGPPRSVDGRTVLVAVMSDSGRLLEVVHAENLERYLLLYHDIGESALLGGFDGVPSDAQIREVIENPQSEVARIRVPVRFRPNQGPQMFLPHPPTETVPTSTPH